MDIEEIACIVGDDVVRDMQALVGRATTAAGSTARGREAVTALLVAMVATTIPNDPDESKFFSHVDDVVEDLRSTCIVFRAEQSGRRDRH